MARTGITKALLATVVAALAFSNVTAINFHYRFYDNGGCDHNTNAIDTFPLNSLPPLSGSSGKCISAPTGVNWNALETDNNLNTGLLILNTFCNINCEGGISADQRDTTCFGPAPGCAIGSFFISQL